VASTARRIGRVFPSVTLERNAFSCIPRFSAGIDLQRALFTDIENCDSRILPQLGEESFG
jgi:hypothetical protein